MSPVVVTASRPVIDLNPSLRVPHDIVLPVEPMKKPLTAETAETAEKKTLRILGALCVLCGKRAFFTRSSGLPLHKQLHSADAQAIAFGELRAVDALVVHERAVRAGEIHDFELFFAG